MSVPSDQPFQSEHPVHHDPPVVSPPAATVHRVADPAPLGLAAFAMTTFALSLSNANIWGPAGAAALALALAYGGTVQVFAGMWEFVRGNTFGALAFSSYGAFWIAYFIFVKFVVGGLAASAVPMAVGTFLLGWTIFTFYLTFAALRVNGAVLVVFVLLTLTFVFLTIGAFNSSTSMTKIGGWLGIATAAAAWYTSFAGVLNDTFKKTVLPTYPLSK